MVTIRSIQYYMSLKKYYYMSKNMSRRKFMHKKRGCNILFVP